MLRTRVITSLIGGPLAIGLIFLGGWWLAIVLWVLSLMAVQEYKNMLAKKQVMVSASTMAATITVIFLFAQLGTRATFLAALPALLPGIFIAALAMRKAGDFSSLFYTAGGALYIGLGFASLLILRRADFLVGYPFFADWGVFFVFCALLGTWFSDIGAFFVGRKYGKHPLAPKISPNKTLEGLAGGMVAVIIGLLIYAYYWSFSWEIMLFFALLIGVAAPAGDLFESLLKRYCGVKDSGNILPGHGGILDRFDSILFAAPMLLTGILLVLENL